MPAKHPYSYLVLRYIHDVVTLEALNVGLLLVSPEARQVSLMITQDHSRSSAVFSGFDPRILSDTLELMARSAERLAAHWQATDFVEPISAEAVAHLLLPADDSSLQWSPPGAGIASDLDYTVRRLFERMVPQPIGVTSVARKLA